MLLEFQLPVTLRSLGAFLKALDRFDRNVKLSWFQGLQECLSHRAVEKVPADTLARLHGSFESRTRTLVSSESVLSTVTTIGMVVHVHLRAALSAADQALHEGGSAARCSDGPGWH